MRSWRGWSWDDGNFGGSGLEPLLAVVLQAVVRIGSRALKNNVMRGLAAVAFVALFLFSVPFPLVILAAGFVGYAGGRARHPAFLGGSGHGSAGGKPVPDAETALGEHIPEHARPNLRWSLRISGVLLALWITPVLALVAALGPHNVFSEIALFFSKMAVVTFGGAYAVLAYVAQQGVEHYGWLRPGEMLDGLGMAETTPGPLIMVTQFVGFMGAFRQATGLPPLVGVGTQNGPRYTLRFCRAFDGAHLAKRSERGGWRIGIGPEVIAGEIDMLPTER